MKKKLFTWIILALSIFSFTENTFSAWSSNDLKDSLWFEKVSEDFTHWTSWSENILINIINNWVDYLLWFLLFISVIYWLYWASLFLFSMTDDDKIKKWKKIITRAIIWMIVVFLAYPITNFIIWDGEKNSWLFQAVNETK